MSSKRVARLTCAEVVQAARTVLLPLEYHDRVYGHKVRHIDIPLANLPAEVCRLNQVLEHARKRLTRFRTTHAIPRAVIFDLTYGQTPKKREGGRKWNSKEGRHRADRDQEAGQPDPEQMDQNDRPDESNASDQ